MSRGGVLRSEVNWLVRYVELQVGDFNVTWWLSRLPWKPGAEHIICLEQVIFSLGLKLSRGSVYSLISADK